MVKEQPIGTQTLGIKLFNNNINFFIEWELGTSFKKMRISPAKGAHLMEAFVDKCDAQRVIAHGHSKATREGLGDINLDTNSGKFSL